MVGFPCKVAEGVYEETLLASLPEAERAAAHLAVQLIVLRRALGWFVADPRFNVSVGGDPNVVPQMIARAQQIYKETEI
jgi:hypothetical protein